MMRRGEFGEASSSSSHSRSPSSPLQTSWNHHHPSPNLHRNQNLFPGDSYSTSNRLFLRSPSDYSISSYFSNGLCSSEDGSSQFASPPFDGMMMTPKTTKHYNDEYNLIDSINRLNIREEEEKTHHHHHHQHFPGNQFNNLGNYEPNDGGFRFGVSSGFGVDKSSLFQNQIWSNSHDRTPNFQQSYGRRNLNPEISPRSIASSSSPNKPNKSLIMEAKNFNNHSGTSMAHRKTLFNNHQSVRKITEIEGNVYLMAKDQHGCRTLQKIFEDGSPLDALIIFKEMIPHVVELMVDPFGNYLMQKVLDVCNEEQRTQIILMVTAEPGQLIRISLNAYGTRVVQRLVESIKTKKQIYLVKSALRPGFLSLIRDLNGNHVIQRCLQCFSTEDNEFIFEDATRFCIDIATHRHGCCVLQRCIAYSTGQQREKLITEISTNSLFLAQDPYGNYAVQFIIELRDFSAIAMVLAQLKGHYVELSMQKFSSHLVERCLTHCPESRSQIVRELISVSHFDLLIQDPYANFVIQAALAVTKGSLHATLVEVIKPYSILRNNPYCKRIFSRNLLKN